jgi:hypothetical protein
MDMTATYSIGREVPLKVRIFEAKRGNKELEHEGLAVAGTHCSFA